MLSVWFIDNPLWPKDSPITPFWKRDVVSAVLDEDGDEAPEAKRGNKVAPAPPADDSPKRRMPALDATTTQKLQELDDADLRETEARPLPTVIGSRQSTPSTVEMSSSDGGREPEVFDRQSLPGLLPSSTNGPAPNLSIFQPALDTLADVPVADDISEVEGDEPPFFESDEDAPYPELPSEYVQPPSPHGVGSRVPPMRGWTTPNESSDEEPFEEGLVDDIRPSSRPTPAARVTPPVSLSASGEILQTVARAEGLTDELHLARGDNYDPFQQAMQGWDQGRLNRGSAAPQFSFRRQGNAAGQTVAPIGPEQARMPRSIYAPVGVEATTLDDAADEELVNEELRGMLFRTSNNGGN